MGLSTVLARLAARRLHVLLVEHPGGFVPRAHAERACTTRGWVMATSPADADVLLECGTRGDDRLAAAVARVWSQVPGPRARGEVVHPDDVESALDGLADAYRRWSPERELPRGSEDGQGPADDMPMGHDEMDISGPGHDSMDISGPGHDSMDMSGPGGIRLASGSDDDRDGLEMDVLHLPLGPVLSSWPAGLVVVCTLSGDVVTAVEVDPVHPTDADPVVDPAAYRLDAAAHVLALAGAGDLAARARRARDRALPRTTHDGRAGLDGAGLDGAGLKGTGDDDLVRRVRRSPGLRWALRRVGPVDAAQAAEHGWPSVWVGDAYDRLLRLLVPCDEDGPATELKDVVDALPHLLVGSELAAARLTVASLVGHRS